MVEIIPRSKVRPPWWINTILITALIFLVVSIAGHIVLRMMVTDLGREIEDAKQRIVDLKTSANQEMESQLLTYQTQIRNFNKIKSERYLTSRVLDLLESTIHPEVVYQNFSINAVEKRILLNGITHSYGSIGEQLLVLNNDERIQRVETNSYSRDKDGWITFRLIIDFNPAIIQ